jgi:hypothetical protein
MAYSVNPLAGIDLTNVETAASILAYGNKGPKFGPLLAIAAGSDGCLYQYAQAGGAITANTTTCAISATGSATATTGAFTSPPTSMAAGDYGWFKTAQLVGTAP